MKNDIIIYMKEAFEASFMCNPQYLISSPGRIELGGNHTDHQQGRVLAAAIDLDIRALVSKRDDNVIHIISDGYTDVKFELKNLAEYKQAGTSVSLTAGVAQAFINNGLKTGGFNAYLTSSLPGGGGLSSSASYEVLMGTIFNVLYNDSIVDAVKIAVFGQYAENEFFGKPSGLMDQLACSVGGINAIDFEDINEPKITHLDFDFSNSGYSVFVISSGADHTDLTDEYASITADMAKISEFFGKKVLRQVCKREFFASLKALRESCGDRAVMRAMHFFAENSRVAAQASALNKKCMNDFLKLAGESGRSSWMLLQNVLLNSNANEGLAITLAVCERALKGEGTCRVHGGGFGGAALAIVPHSREEAFLCEVEAILGKGICIKINIRNTGPQVYKL